MSDVLIIMQRDRQTDNSKRYVRSLFFKDIIGEELIKEPHGKHLSIDVGDVALTQRSEKKINYPSLCKKVLLQRAFYNERNM